MNSLRHYLEENDYVRIPLKKLITGHYKLRARLNGVEGWFILDTGASNSCVGLEQVSYFQLDTEESDVKAAGAGSIGMDTQLSRGNFFQLGSLKLAAITWVLFDLSHVNIALSQADEPPVHGILGADLLKTRRAVIDYGRNALYLK